MKVVCFQVHCLKFLVESVSVFIYVHQAYVHVYGFVIMRQRTHVFHVCTASLLFFLISYALIDIAFYGLIDDH